MRIECQNPLAFLDYINEEKNISDINFRVNEIIRSSQVRLIDAKGDNVGVVPIDKAQKMARDADLDLVEVAPGADPPVCRIMDFGKFLYEREKKEREAKKSQTKIEIKEIRLRPKTNIHHRHFKTQDARRWLEDGMKVRVSIRFRGREIIHPEVALEDLKEIAEELYDISTVEQAPSLEGKMMGMTLTPAKLGKKRSPSTGEKAKLKEKPEVIADKKSKKVNNPKETPPQPEPTQV
ncbi:MAG: translation initiation factor IF-3 [Anaerolineaceae bacterium]|nr:translation initiation factor IF-3 [Anaerolineaceae bacterium]